MISTSWQKSLPATTLVQVHGMTLQIKLYWDGLVKAILLYLYKVADGMSYWYCNLRRDYCYPPSILSFVTAIESSYFGVMKFWRESSTPPTQHWTSLCICVAVACVPWWSAIPLISHIISIVLCRLFFMFRRDGSSAMMMSTMGGATCLIASLIAIAGFF